MNTDTVFMEPEEIQALLQSFKRRPNVLRSQASDARERANLSGPDPVGRRFESERIASLESGKPGKTA